MRVKKLGLGIILVAGMLIAGARARAGEPLTVQRLLYQCQSTSGEFCLGYVGGVGDLMELNDFLRLGNPGFKGASMCTGGLTPTYEARVQAFENWAQAHPESWSEPALNGV